MRFLRFMRRFFDELLLSSGQYTLFFLILAFAVERHLVFLNTGFFALTLTLIAQTCFLVLWGDKTLVRFLLSTLCPLAFCVLQAKAGGFSPWNMNVVFFWTSQAYFALFKSWSRVTTSQTMKRACEYLLSIGTVVVFLFLAFYYNLMILFGLNKVSGLLSGSQASSFFSIANILPSLGNFLVEPSHRFVIFGCFLIGFILALGRIRILALKYRMSYLFEANADEWHALPDILPETSFEKSNAAVLYCDIRNFSQISENYPDRAVIDALNLYYATWETIARKYGGRVEKFIGDSIMIIFRNSADLAITCAIDFLDQLPAFQEEYQIRNLPAIHQVGIGLAWGEITTSWFGVGDRMTKNIFGHPPSIASRMESLCREFHQDLVIDSDCYEKAGLEQQVKFLPIGEVLVRGKLAPMVVYGRK